MSRLTGLVNTPRDLSASLCCAPALSSTLIGLFSWQELLLSAFIYTLAFLSLSPCCHEWLCHVFVTSKHRRIAVKHRLQHHGTDNQREGALKPLSRPNPGSIRTPATQNLQQTKELGRIRHEISGAPHNSKNARQNKRNSWVL